MAVCTREFDLLSTSRWWCGTTFIIFVKVSPFSLSLSLCLSKEKVFQFELYMYVHNQVCQEFGNCRKTFFFKFNSTVCTSCKRLGRCMQYMCMIYCIQRPKCSNRFSSLTLLVITFQPWQKKPTKTFFCFFTRSALPSIYITHTCKKSAHRFIKNIYGMWYLSMIHLSKHLQWTQTTTKNIFEMEN